VRDQALDDLEHAVAVVAVGHVVGGVLEVGTAFAVRAEYSDMSEQGVVVLAVARGRRSCAATARARRARA
jgi:hypothetical protein